MLLPTEDEAEAGIVTTSSIEVPLWPSLRKIKLTTKKEKKQASIFLCLRGYCLQVYKLVIFDICSIFYSNFTGHISD